MLYRFIRMYPEEEWRRWRLCSDTPIAPQNPVFLSIPRSRLARYDTSSAAFRLLIYGEKVGKKTVSRGRNGELLHANQPISKPGIKPASLSI